MNTKKTRLEDKPPVAAVSRERQGENRIIASVDRFLFFHFLLFLFLFLLLIAAALACVGFTCCCCCSRRCPQAALLSDTHTHTHTYTPAFEWATAGVGSDGAAGPAGSRPGRRPAIIIRWMENPSDPFRQSAVFRRKETFSAAVFRS